MELEAENNNGDDHRLRARIAEMERMLEEERKRRRALLELESDLAKVAASQEATRYKSECLILRNKVASLEQEGNILRERGLLEQDQVKGLMEKMEEKEAKLADLMAKNMEYGQAEAEKEKAVGEVGRLKERIAALEAILLNLWEAIEGFKHQSVEIEKERRRLGRAMTRIEGGVREWKKKHVEVEARSSAYIAGLVENLMNEKDACNDSDDEPLVQRRKKRRDAVNLPGECSNSPCNATGETQSVKPLRIKSLPRKKDGAEESLDMMAGSHVPVGRKVSNKVAQAYHKRNFNNQARERAYVGRIPSSEQRKQAEKRAEELRSKLKACNPSFVKPMVQSHVSGCFYLGLPTKFCTEKLPTCELKMILEDENGVECGVKYFGGLKPALSGGWRRFALDHNLELGDAVIFELIEPTRFKVYIIKAIPEESCEDPDNKAANEQSHGTDSWGSLDSAEDQDVDPCNV